jgi:mannosyl-glycoprotein endo-beta-N-acetylglucosaminidase
MDVDKQTTMGDLLWPAPTLKWEAESAGTVPDVAISLNTSDSWNSGSSIQIDFTEKEANPNLSYRSFYTPIQTLSLTAQKSYTASIIYKPNQPSDAADIDLSLTLSIRPRSTDSTAEVKITPDSLKATEISNNWTKVTVQFIITDIPRSTITVDSEIGLVIETVSNGTTPPFSLSLLLGQMNIFPTPSSTIEPNYPRILWADSTPTTITVPDPTPMTKEADKNNSNPPTAQDTTQALTTITWMPTTSLSQVGQITITSPDDPNCAWTPQPPLESQWFPGMLYCNIYAAEPGAAIRAFAKARTTTTVAASSGEKKQRILEAPGSGMIWLGTSGADGSVGKGKSEFSFDRTQLSAELKDLTTLRVFVQGVLETGEVLSWENSAFVDVQY